MFELIRQLVNLYGATGREAGVADAVEALVKDHVDSIRRDALGNLICEKRGTDPDGKRIMLSAHMDHIGFIVVAVEKEGFLRVMPVGGVKEKILAAKRAGITELILSEENRKDIAEIKEDYIAGLTFHYVKTNDEVLKLALE